MTLSEDKKFEEAYQADLADFRKFAGEVSDLLEEDDAELAYFRLKMFVRVSAILLEKVEDRINYSIIQDMSDRFSTTPKDEEIEVFGNYI